MNNKVQQYYCERINKNESNNFLWQVGKTVNGKVVSEDHLEIIIKTIINRLKLNKNDNLLDVGCGNGLLTKKIAEYVFSATGVELTPELFEIANKYNLGNNIRYINDNILKFDEKDTKKYSKVYLYEVIQHLNYQEANELFYKLNEITVSNATIFIGGVLDVEKKWEFFDSEERRGVYFTSLLSGGSSLGTWYYKGFFKFLAEKHGFYVDLWNCT